MNGHNTHVNPFTVYFFLLSAFCFLPSILSAQTKADTIHVIHYDINLEIRNFSQGEINGYADVNIQAKIAPLDSIILDFKALAVDSVKKGETHIPHNHIGEQLNIIMSFSAVGQTETISIYYHGKPHKDAGPWGGGFIFNGEDYAYNIGVSMANYPHSFGRVWYPCIDDFNDKSTYTFNIITDTDKKAVCGGMLVDSANYGDTKSWQWELTDPIPTYLSSVAVGKYKIYKDSVLSISGNYLPIEIYADSAKISDVPGSFIHLKTFIQTYENRWGMCRWQKVGYVAVPFNGGAMEHATNIAFPRNYINGNTNNESLISHELAHSWFGNLITCSTSQNMWINEGFATYGALLCDEILDPTLVKFNDGIKKLHHDFLKSSEAGKYALDNVPTDATYSSTSYDRGGMVAHTLRKYMGDELFFSSVKTLLNQNQYKNMDSKEFLDKLSVISKMDLNDFYLGWVNQKGFLNFNIDSVKSLGGNKYQISLKQKLYLAERLANSNKLDVEFYSAIGEKYLVEKIEFSGESEIVTVDIPFEPVFWSIDPNRNSGLACFSTNQTISNTNNINLLDYYFQIKASEITAPSVLRIEHNPVAPTPAKKVHPNIYKISETHFWRVGFLEYNTMSADYSFRFADKYDKELLEGYTTNDLLLLYRKDVSHDWQTITLDSITVNNQMVYLHIHNILPGEYTLGVGKEIGIKEIENKFDVTVYPNPTTGELRMENGKLRIENVEIFDIYGRNLSSYLTPHTSYLLPHTSIDISGLEVGIYFVRITTEQGIVTKKFVKE